MEGFLQNRSSTKVRVKKDFEVAHIALKKYLEKFNVDVRANSIPVQAMRRSVVVVRIGRINSKTCFIQDAPLLSFARSAEYSTYACSLVPDGFQTAFIFSRTAWTAEVAVNNTSIKYKFSHINNDGQVDLESSYHATPSKAFSEVASKVRSTVENFKVPSSINGKLLLGCHYETVQSLLRQYFKANSGSEYINPHLEPDVQRWLNSKIFVKPPPSKPKTKKSLKRSHDEISQPPNTNSNLPFDLEADGEQAALDPNFFKSIEDCEFF